MLNQIETKIAELEQANTDVGAELVELYAIREEMREQVYEIDVLKAFVETLSKRTDDIGLEAFEALESLKSPLDKRMGSPLEGLSNLKIKKEGE